MTFHSPKTLPSALIVMFVATITPYGFATAEHGPNTPSYQPACDVGKKQTCVKLVQDNILWRISEPENPASKHWAQENLDKLCSCTNAPYETVNCFQVKVNNNRKTWREAIAMCRANP